ncbi:MAG: TIGR00725 family protein [Candidatus Hydrothermarchaeales archaeon]
MLYIGVIGSSSADEKLRKAAEKVGEELAKASCILVCGGLTGVMEAAAKGAKKEGGLTVGILPGFTKDEANKYIDVKIVTAMSHARNAIVARTADVLIAVGGELGTLSEISLGLKMGKPVVILEGVGGVGSRVEGLNEKVHFSKSPEEAVKLAQKLGGEGVEREPD